MKKQRKILHIFAIILMIACVSCSKTEVEDMREFEMSQKNQTMAPPGGGITRNTWHYDCYLEGLPEGEWGYKCQIHHLIQSVVCTECYTNECAEKDQCYYTHS